MSDVTRIHSTKQPNRPHYIREWAEKRGFRKAVELARNVGADKSVVSRWYNGGTPTEEYQERLADLFHCDREALFRHPDDDWLTRFFQGRSEEESEKIKRVLEDLFPRTGTDK